VSFPFPHIPVDRLGPTDPRASARLVGQRHHFTPTRLSDYGLVVPGLRFSESDEILYHKVGAFATMKPEPELGLGIAHDLGGTLTESHRHELVMVRVLGPVEVVTSGGVLEIGSRLQRAVLAALAISANHTVSSDQLAQILWQDRPPASRDNTLQTYIARLRNVVGHDRISTAEEHGYQLHVAGDELDAMVFERLANQAATIRSEPDRCLGMCRQALALWRGVPFGELVDDDPFRLEAIRLDEVRLFVIELRLECELALGRGEVVVGALEALVEEYPYRERMWHLLIAALSLCGRRVEALRACDQLRKVLGDVGLEPTIEIRHLEDDIIDEDPAVRPRLRFLLAQNGSGH